MQRGLRWLGGLRGSGDEQHTRTKLLESFVVFGGSGCITSFDGTVDIVGHGYTGGSMGVVGFRYFEGLVGFEGSMGFGGIVAYMGFGCLVGIEG